MIPKKVHISWKDKNLLKEDHELVHLGIARLHKLNPDWEIEISDDADIDAYLEKFLPTKDYDIIKDKHIVQKCDLWRLIKMLFEGGLYIDIDRLCDVNLNELILEGVTWVLPTCEDHDFSHDFMMSAPGNPVFYHAVSLYLHRMQTHPDSIYYLGPQTYFSAVGHVLLGMHNISPSPEKNMLSVLRLAIKDHPNITTYREKPPYNTITYRGGFTRTDHEKMKRDFYAKSGLKHWSGEW